MKNRTAKIKNPIVQELGPAGPWLVDLLDGQGLPRGDLA